MSEKDRAKVKDIANDIATDARYNVSITASLNGAEISTKIFKDPEMASQLRMLVGNGTYEKLNTAQIMHTLLTSGKEENYDTLLGAYSEMLAGDLKSKTPSTNIQYLADSYSRLNEVASTASLLKSAGTTLQKINDKHETHVKSPAVLAKSVLEFSMKPGQAELETIATEFMRIGSGKKLFFANKFLNMLDKLPMPVWDSDIQKRDRAMTEVLHYTSNKTDFNSQFQPGMNKAFQ